jgi:hypothetical protein
MILQKKAKLGAKGEAVPADDEGAVGKLSLGQKVKHTRTRKFCLLWFWFFPRRSKAENRQKVLVKFAHLENIPLLDYS